MTDNSILFWAAWAILLVTLYPVPSAVAFFRRHPQRAQIVALNILLGWTVIGWAIALVWAKSRFCKRTAP
jgi:hypothetical protein